MCMLSHWKTLPCTYLCSSPAGSVFVFCLVVEELVQLVQRLTSSEENHTASVASLTDAVNRIRAEHEAVVSDTQYVLDVQ